MHRRLSANSKILIEKNVRPEYHAVAKLRGRFSQKILEKVDFFRSRVFFWGGGRGMFGDER